MAGKVLRLSANSRYLQCLITLQRSLINRLQLKVLKQASVGPPENLKNKEILSKLHMEYCRIENKYKTNLGNH